MILIVDSGSTKTSWLINCDNLHFATAGLNPYYVKEDKLREEISGHVANKVFSKEVKHLYFYGAGCGSQQNKDLMNKILSEIYPNAKIEVQTDILGAARALFGRNKGIACILGTGANSCCYDGKEIYDIVPSTGFIFGDEGSAAQLGKELINSYLRNSLPEDLQISLREKYNINYSSILDNVYRQPFPNLFLASFSEFICENSKNEFIKNLVKLNFSKFIDYYIKSYTEYESLPISFVGSVSYFFKDLLKQVFKENNLKISEIIRNPIDNRN